MTQSKNKILLTGYRATGKTSIGLEIARRLEFTFIDTDREIEEKTGKTISRLVSEKGWQHFRDLEKQILRELADRNNLVIASGGGAVMHHDQWRKLRRGALTVWLTASAATICSRLEKDHKSDDQRPSLTGRDTLEEVEYVLNQRLSIYEEGSDLRVDSEEDITTVADGIMKAWEKEK